MQNRAEDRVRFYTDCLVFQIISKFSLAECKCLMNYISYRWAHVMCAVGLPEVKFIDVVKRAPIDISAIPVQRYKLVSHKHTHTHL